MESSTKIHWMHIPDTSHYNEDYWKCEWELAQELFVLIAREAKFFDGKAQDLLAQAAERRDKALRSFLECQNDRTTQTINILTGSMGKV